MSLICGVDKKAFSIAEDQGNKRYHLFLILVSYALVVNQMAKIVWNHLLMARFIPDFVLDCLFQKVLQQTLGID